MAPTSAFQGMDDVTEKMKDPFAEHGVGENISQELPLSQKAMAVANFPTRYEESYAYDGAADLYGLPQNEGANDDVNEDAVPNPSMTTQQIDDLILQEWNKAQSKKTSICSCLVSYLLPNFHSLELHQHEDVVDDDDEIAKEIGSDLNEADL
ncbi:hypothetical protein HDV00_010136 [Rhizophlyctis rosea]|nr:hypothetical protein HDV00_010136 [Rhizophlyctis rosea]